MTSDDFRKNRDFFSDIRKKSRTEAACFLNPKSNVILSAPHAINQTREGELKGEEPVSISYVATLAALTGANSIYKVNNETNDANYDVKSVYKDKLRRTISKGNIKVLLDFHSMAYERTELVNIGTARGELLQTEEKKAYFNTLLRFFWESGLKVSVDYPFCANPRTIANTFGRDPSLLALQLELNNKLSEPEYNRELNASLDALENFIKCVQLIC